MIIGFDGKFYESIKSDSCLRCRFYKKDTPCEMNKKVICMDIDTGHSIIWAELKKSTINEILKKYAKEIK